jgi:predicted TIM-barrel fold metal-dependent hydrolase
MAKQGFKVMDSDIHVSEPPDLWERYLEPAFKDRGPRLARTNGEGSERLVVTAKALISHAIEGVPGYQRTRQIRMAKAREKAIESGRAALTGHAAGRGDDPKNMVAAMEVEGIDVSIVFRTEGAHVLGFDARDGMDGPLAAAICRAYNTWAHDFCSADPERLKMAAQMPIQDVGEAVTEARRAVQELGAITLVLPNHSVNERPWYDEYYHPFWAEAERLGVPVSFHGIHVARQQHLHLRYMDNHALGHIAGHAMEMMLALSSMLLGGVFERFPKLTAAFLEGNCSWIPWLLWALDEHEDQMGDKERFGLTMPPSAYFRRQCFVSVEPDEHPAKYVIQEIGDDNIVISTDWPHGDSRYPQAIDTFLGLEGISDDSKRKILWDNCARLYRIEAPSEAGER